MRVLTILLLAFVVALIVAMIRSFFRNAVALRRDVDRRFDDLSERLADEARRTIDPLLKRDPNDRTT